MTVGDIFDLNSLLEFAFFFQAEDGIRDTSVTGVQTCALPISQILVVQLMLEEKAYGKDLEDLRAKLGLDRPIHVQYRSEERRVGKECRAWWSPEHKKKK